MTFKEIDDRLSILPDYLYYLADKRIKNETDIMSCDEWYKLYGSYLAKRKSTEKEYNLNSFIIPFDTYYKLGSDFKRNEYISNCGIRRTGRTRAMVENILESCKQGYRQIFVETLVSQLDYILRELVKVGGKLEMDIDHKYVYSFIRFPETIIKFIFVDPNYPKRHEDHYRGRRSHTYKIFTDHYTDEKIYEVGMKFWDTPIPPKDKDDFYFIF